MYNYKPLNISGSHCTVNSVAVTRVGPMAIASVGIEKVVRVWSWDRGYFSMAAQKDSVAAADVPPGCREDTDLIAEMNREADRIRRYNRMGLDDFTMRVLDGESVSDESIESEIYEMNSFFSDSSSDSSASDSEMGSGGSSGPAGGLHRMDSDSEMSSSDDSGVDAPMLPVGEEEMDRFDVVEMLREPVPNDDYLGSSVGSDEDLSEGDSFYSASSDMSE